MSFSECPENKIFLIKYLYQNASIDFPCKTLNVWKLFQKRSFILQDFNKTGVQGTIKSHLNTFFKVLIYLLIHKIQQNFQKI